MSTLDLDIDVRGTTPADFSQISSLCEQVYPSSPPWTPKLLSSHLSVFPEGQMVAVDRSTARVVGMSASLVITWNDYDAQGSWHEFTAGGSFRNHDPSGRTLYGAEVMVDPTMQRHGIGKRLYAARRDLVERLGLLRIRAGARLRGYGKLASTMTAEEYVIKVVRGELVGPTLSFQLSEGFVVIAVVSGYLSYDAESLGYAALIEWLNAAVATAADSSARDPKFLKPSD